MYLTKVLLLFALLIGLSATANSQTKDFFTLEKLESYLNYIHLKKGFNGEILVGKGNNIIFQKSVGVASYEHSIKLENGAKYKIASVTKTFTGSLIAIAEEERRLKVQDKAIDYIPVLSSKFRDITIEQLLSHTSGLPHHEGIKDYWLTKSKLQMNPEQVITEINMLDLLFVPGSEMKYSSYGYYLLASILENIYKSGFEDILKIKILNKLQMKQTGIVNNLTIIPQIASGYHLLTDDSLIVAPYRDYSMLKGAGDMYSTSTDLLKWNNSFFSNALLSERATAFIQGSKTEATKGNKYSYGWHVNSEDPQKQYHGGGTWGYSTYTAAYPENQISIILLSNVSTLPISEIAEDVEKIVLGKPFQIPPVPEIFNEPINLDLYCGIFFSDSNEMALNITKHGNSLYAKLGSNPPFEIYPLGSHQFFGKKIEIEITFEIISDLITGLSAERMGQIFHFKKEAK